MSKPQGLASGVGAYAKAAGYLVIPIGVREHFKRSTSSAVIGLVTLLLCLAVFAVSCAYYARDTSLIVSPQGSDGQTVKDCHPILLPQNELRAWDSSSRWEGDPKFSPARQLWTVELKGFTNDKQGTQDAMAKLQEKAHALLDQLSNPSQPLDYQYHRKLQRLLFEELRVDGKTGSARLKPAVNAATFIEVSSQQTRQIVIEVLLLVAIEFLPDKGLHQMHTSTGTVCDIEEPKAIKLL
jgi:hypothetical protein